MASSVDVKGPPVSPPTEEKPATDKRDLAEMTSKLVDMLGGPAKKQNHAPLKRPAAAEPPAAPAAKFAKVAKDLPFKGVPTRARDPIEYKGFVIKTDVASVCWRASTEGRSRCFTFRNNAKDNWMKLVHFIANGGK